MGFFSDLREDLSQAVDEMVEDEKTVAAAEEPVQEKVVEIERKKRKWNKKKTISKNLLF